MSWTLSQFKLLSVVTRVQQGLDPRLSLDNPDHHSPWHLVLPWFHQVSRVPCSRKKQAPWTLQSPTIFGVSVKFVRFSAKFWSLHVKFRNNIENIISLPCKWSKHVNYKSRPCIYCVTPLKRNENIFLAKYMIYAVLATCETCYNLRGISLPSTWSSSILTSHPLPLKPILILCQPLVVTIKVFEFCNNLR